MFNISISVVLMGGKHLQSAAQFMINCESGQQSDYPD